MSTFDVSFQRALLRLCMVEEPFCRQVMRYVEPSFFTTESLGWCFRTMKRYFDEYGGAPTNSVLRTEAGKAKTEHVPLYAYEVEQIIQLAAVAEGSYIKSELKEFIQRNMFTQAHRDSATLYNAGQYDEAYDLTMRSADEIRKVSFDPPDRSWLFDELEQRQRRRYLSSLDPTAGVYTTGIPPLDGILRGGLHKGELFYILGDAKIGKTTWMINMGFVATRVCRVPVLHFNLEGGTTLVEDRYDSCFSQELYWQVKRGEIDTTLYREMQAEYQALRGLLVIRTINDWSVNILDIEAELKELKVQGFEPEMIIIDYGDLLDQRPGVRADSATAKQLASARDMSTLAKRGYGIWTGSQVQRPKTKKDTAEAVLRARDIADCYAKVRVASGWGSLNATIEEKKRGEMRLFWEGYRDGIVGKMFKLTNRFDRMRYGVTATEVAMTPPSTKGTKGGS